MTCRISRFVFAMALAFGMLAALSDPGRAALSTADRTDAPVAAAPKPETHAATSAASAPAPAKPAAAAPVAAAAAAVAERPRRAVVHKAKPRRIATTGLRGYPCH